MNELYRTVERIDLALHRRFGDRELPIICALERFLYWRTGGQGWNR